MQREISMTAWWIFSFVATGGLLIPVAAYTFSHGEGVAATQNAQWASALWGNTPLPATVSTWEEASSSANVVSNFGAFNGTPKLSVSGVAWTSGQWPPAVLLTGDGFGNEAANGRLTVEDLTQGWMTGSPVVPVISSWNHDAIDVAGWRGYGAAGDVFQAGDQLLITVTNPQTGVMGTVKTSFPALTEPRLTLSTPLTQADVGSTVPISGHLSLGGVPLSDVPVSLSWATTDASTSVTTDGNGDYLTSIAVPMTVGRQTLTADYEGVAAQWSMDVTAP